LRRNRIIWLVLFILSLVSISYFGGPVSYGFFFTMLLIPVVSLAYIMYVIICFRIYQYNDGKAFVVDNPVPYSFRLINEFPIPFAGIRVRFFSSFSTINELSDKTEYELMPNTGISRETTIVCHYRGEYEIGIKEVEVQDYFRLFKIKYVNRETRRVTVNPKIVFLSNLKSFEMHAEDAVNNPSRPDIVTREYVPGDDLRLINWNQTARTGVLMTKERIGEEGNGVSVITDICRYSSEQAVYLPVENKILEIAIAVSLFFANKNIGTKEYHISGGLVTAIVNNNQQFDDFYKIMSAISFDEANTQKKLFEALIDDNSLFHSAVVYMVLQKWSESAADMVNSLSRRNIFTVVYIVSDESKDKPLVDRTDMAQIIYISPEAKLEEVLL